MRSTQERRYATIRHCTPKRSARKAWKRLAKHDGRLPARRILTLFIALLVFGVGLIVVSRWILSEFGRIVYGGSEARPLAVDSTLLGVGSAIALLAVIGIGFSLLVAGRFSRALHAAGETGLAFPAERISSAAADIEANPEGAGPSPARLPYYFSVSVSHGALALWASDDEPISQIDLRRIRKVALARETPPSLRRVLTISFSDGAPDFSLSVMSARWLLLPEAGVSTMRRITGDIAQFASRSEVER